MNSDEPLPRPMLLALAELISADLVQYFELRRDDRSAVAYSTSRDVEVPAGIPEAVATFGHQNPIRAYRWEPADGPLRLSAVVSHRALQRLDFHDTFLRPMGIRDTLKVWLWSSPHSVACVSLDRSDGTFSNRDATVLGVLQPHLTLLREQGPARNGASRDDDFSLTPRETQVLVWVTRGKRNEEIARLLFMSPATVRKHLEHVYEKLGVQSRAEAIARLTLVPIS